MECVSQQKNNHVYWLKGMSDVDVLSQGYCGITSNPEVRFKAHKNDDRLKNAHLKEMVILASDLTRDEALTLEYMLRPLRNIGDNKKAGGDSLSTVGSKSLLSLYRSITKEHFYSPCSVGRAICLWENNLPKSMHRCKAILELILKDSRTVFRLLSGDERLYKKLYCSCIDTEYRVRLHDCFSSFIESSASSGFKLKFNKEHAKRLESELESFVLDYGWAEAVDVARVTLATSVIGEFENRGQGRCRELPITLPKVTYAAWSAA